MGSFTAGAGTSYLLSSTAPVPSGTANGVLYLNGSKVVSSGSALTFDGTNFGVGTASPTLLFQVGSRGGMDSTGIFRWGSALTGNNRGVLSWDTNIASIGAPQNLVFCANSETTERMRLDSSGNLGIGTSSPTFKLDVQGDVRINGGNQLRFFRPDNSTQGLNIFSNASNNFIQAPVGAIIFDGTNSLTFDVTGVVTWRNSGGSTERMRLDASGNLGLGVVPSAWSGLASALQVQRASIITSSAAAVDTYFSSNAFYDGSWKYISSAPATQYVQNASGDHRWRVAASGTAGNAISFTQAMTLDASGNLGIGTTSTSAAVLNVYSSTGAPSIRITALSGNPYIQFESGGFIQDIGNGSFRIRGVGASSGIDFDTNSTLRARIPSAGGMIVGTAALATTATDGFLYVPTCAGTPTGTPTTQTGTAPIVINTTNNKLYFYSGGAWRDAGP